MSFSLVPREQFCHSPLSTALGTGTGQGYRFIFCTRHPGCPPVGMLMTSIRDSLNNYAVCHYKLLCLALVTPLECVSDGNAATQKKRGDRPHHFNPLLLLLLLFSSSSFLFSSSSSSCSSSSFSFFFLPFSFSSSSSPPTPP